LEKNLKIIIIRINEINVFLENKKCCANIFDFKYQKNKNKNECNYAKTGNLLASAVYTSIMYIYLEEQPV